MTKITHDFPDPNFTSGPVYTPRVCVSLPHVPGAEPDTAREETAPRMPMIRAQQPRPRVLHGAAARANGARLVARFRAALIEVMEGAE